VTLPRIYLPRPLRTGDLVAATPDQARYLLTVLRLGAGDPLRVFDGANGEYEARIRPRTPEAIDLEIGGRRPAPAAAAAPVTLYQAIPKADKMDLIIRQATELGVGRIIPFFAERSVPRWPAEKSPLKRARWQKIAVEACRQCGRSDVPEIGAVVSLAEAIASPLPAALNLLLWEGEVALGLRECLRGPQYRGRTSFSLLIGPEGGFQWGEVERAGEAGFVSVSLGRRILRVDTAALAALTVIQYESGALGGPAEETGGGK
jgi:16S rRNA (uracil1498-N3)-methyltransferase